MIFAASSTLEDVYMNEGVGSSSPLVYRYVLQGNTAMSKIGFNIGAETYKFYGAGVIYGLEIGMMPGVKVSGAGNGYLCMKWGFIFGKAFGGK